MNAAHLRDETLEEIERLIERRRVQASNGSDLLPELSGSFVPLPMPRGPADAHQLKMLEQQNEFLGVDLAARTARVAALEAELAAQTRANHEAETALHDRVSTLEKENGDLRCQLTTATSRLADLHQKLASAQSTISSMEKANEQRLAEQKRSLHKKLDRAREKAAADRGTAEGLHQVTTGLSQKLRKAESELEILHRFFHQNAALVSQVDPPPRLRRAWVQFRQRFELDNPPRPASRPGVQRASISRVTSSGNSRPKRPITSSGINQSMSSTRGADLLNRSRQSVASRRSSRVEDTEDLEAEIDRKEAELSRVKAEYKKLLFRDEQSLAKDPLMREKANFFAREVQALSRHLLELRKRQRQLFARECFN